MDLSVDRRAVAPHPHLFPRSVAEHATLEAIEPSRVCFVFGSNMNGLHGGGAALTAWLYFGAGLGRPSGRQGQAYAIPTISAGMKTLPIETIKAFVDRFRREATDDPGTTYYVTALGTGIAGLTHEQMAPLFVGMPANVLLPPEWLALQIGGVQ